MEKFEVKKAIVTSVGEKSVDEDGVKSIMLKDQSFFVSSMSTRDHADIEIGQEFILLVDSQRSQPFALYDSHRNYWIFSTHSESYDRWPLWAKVISVMPFSSLFMFQSLFEIENGAQWTKLYDEKKFIRRKRIYFSISVLNFALSMAGVVMPYFGYITWFDGAMMLAAHGIANFLAALGYDEMYQRIYDDNFKVAKKALNKFMGRDDEKDQ